MQINSRLTPIADGLVGTVTQAKGGPRNFLDCPSSRGRPACSRLLVRSPGRVCGEEAIHEADPISDKQTKNQADHARGRNESLVEPGQATARKGERNREGQRHQHHPGNRSETKDQQVENGPSWLANCAQYQERDRGRARQAMDNAYEQRPQRMKDSQPYERSAQPMRGLDFPGVMFGACR